MQFPWVIVGGTGYDVEEVDAPATREMVCPGCERNVRFVEKTLIKNLRVLGVPLVGVEPGRKVFECPHCRVCVEPPSETEQTAVEEPERAAEIERMRDELWLWQSRVELAGRRGDAALAADARAYVARLERALGALQASRAVEQSDRSPRTPTADASPPRAPVAPREASDAGEQDVDRAFAALKSRLASARARADGAAESAPVARDGSAPVDLVEPANSPSPSRASDSNEVDAEFAALRARVRSAVGSAHPASPAIDATAARADDLNAPAVAADASDPEPTAEDPAAVLKRRLRGGR